MALPFLEAMIPARRAHAATSLKGVASAPVKRMVCVGNPFGMYADGFFPEENGSNYTLPSVLEPFEAHRSDLTIFSNLDHGVTGGHRGVHALLSGVRIQDAGHMPEGNITLDQKAADFIGAGTRFPSLNTATSGGCEMSWTRTGVRVPPIKDLGSVFEALFVEQGAEAKQHRAKELRLNASVLDAVRGQAKSLQRRLGKSDQEKLDEYFTSVRELEKKIGMSKEWLGRPKPSIDMKRPKAGTSVDDLPILYDLILLALQTDSTRVATVEVDFTSGIADLGVKSSYHKYSHHGMLEELVQGLILIEKYQMKHFARFLGKLKATEDPLNGGNLLDHTMVLFGSGMGNGSSHSNKDLPMLLAGGGFKHGQHLRLPEAKNERVPLCNLYLSMLQNFGLEVDRFGTSSGTLTGLELS